MTRNYLCCAVLASLWLHSVAFAARIERGGLIYDDIPDAPAEPDARLSTYLAGREALSLGWSPKGELLISTRFGDIAELHVVDRPGADRRPDHIRGGAHHRRGLFPRPWAAAR